jgi:hypothetical protein
MLLAPLREFMPTAFKVRYDQTLFLPYNSKLQFFPFSSLTSFATNSNAVNREWINARLTEYSQQCKSSLRFLLNLPSQQHFDNFELTPPLKLTLLLFLSPFFYRRYY